MCMEHVYRKLMPEHTTFFSEDDAEMAMPHIAPGPNKKPLERKRTVVWERDDTKGGVCWRLAGLSG